MPCPLPDSQLLNPVEITSGMPHPLSKPELLNLTAGMLHSLPDYELLKAGEMTAGIPCPLSDSELPNPGDIINVGMLHTLFPTLNF